MCALPSAETVPSPNTILRPRVIKNICKKKRFFYVLIHLNLQKQLLILTLFVQILKDNMKYWRGKFPYKHGHRPFCFAYGFGKLSFLLIQHKKGTWKQWSGGPASSLSLSYPASPPPRTHAYGDKRTAPLLGKYVTLQRYFKYFREFTDVILDKNTKGERQPIAK